MDIPVKGDALRQLQQDVMDGAVTDPTLVDAISPELTDAERYRQAGIREPGDRIIRATPQVQVENTSQAVTSTPTPPVPRIWAQDHAFLVNTLQEQQANRAVAVASTSAQAAPPTVPLAPTFKGHPNVRPNGHVIGRPNGRITGRPINYDILSN